MRTLRSLNPALVLIRCCLSYLSFEDIDVIICHSSANLRKWRNNVYNCFFCTMREMYYICPTVEQPLHITTESTWNGLRNWTLLLIKLMNLNNYCIGHCWSMLGIIMSFEESSLKCLSCKNEDLSLILGTHTEKLLWWQAITISMLKEVEMGLTGTHWTASLTNLLREFWATDKPCFVLF